MYVCIIRLPSVSKSNICIYLHKIDYSVSKSNICIYLHTARSLLANLHTYVSNLPVRFRFRRTFVSYASSCLTYLTKALYLRGLKNLFRMNLQSSKNFKRFLKAMKDTLNDYFFGNVIVALL